MTTGAAATARGDLGFGLFWAVLGAAIAFESWRMPRLEEQGINPYTVPGLVPGLLGAVLLLFGLTLALRGRRGGAAADAPAEAAVAEDGADAPEDGADAAVQPVADGPQPWRAALALALCLGFGFGLLGNGPPFWLAAGLFLFLAVFLFQLPERRDAGARARGALLALAVAAGGAAFATFVFQEVFLVRLP